MIKYATKCKRAKHLKHEEDINQSKPPTSVYFHRLATIAFVAGIPVMSSSTDDVKAFLRHRHYQNTVKLQPSYKLLP